MSYKSSTRGYVEASYKFTKESYISFMNSLIEDLQTHVKNVEKDVYFMMPLTGPSIPALFMNYGRLEELKEIKKCLDGDQIE